jgi:hypothetical protein
MVLRNLLAVVIAVAVATAPVAYALAPSQLSAVTTDHSAAGDCQRGSTHHGDAKHCPDCGDMQPVSQTKCPGDGSKCCKLTGAIASLFEMPAGEAVIVAAPDPTEPPAWSDRPRPPPPRA